HDLRESDGADGAQCMVVELTLNLHETERELRLDALGHRDIIDRRRQIRGHMVLRREREHRLHALQLRGREIQLAPRLVELIPQVGRPNNEEGRDLCPRLTRLMAFKRDDRYAAGQDGDNAVPPTRATTLDFTSTCVLTFVLSHGLGFLSKSV